jgi:hypothetical protein
MMYSCGRSTAAAGGVAAISPVAHAPQLPDRLLAPVEQAVQGLHVGGSMPPFRPQKRPAGERGRAWAHGQ